MYKFLQLYFNWAMESSNIIYWSATFSVVELHIQISIKPFIRFFTENGNPPTFESFPPWSYIMFSFTSNPTSIYVKFNGSDWRTKKSVKISGQPKNEEMLLFAGYETVSGTVEIVLPPGRTIDHLGIKIEMIGQIGEDMLTTVYWPLYIDHYKFDEYILLDPQSYISASAHVSNIFQILTFLS